MADDILNNNGSEVEVASLRLGTSKLDQDAKTAKKIIEETFKSKSLLEGVKSISTAITSAANRAMTRAGKIVEAGVSAIAKNLKKIDKNYILYKEDKEGHEVGYRDTAIDIKSMAERAERMSVLLRSSDYKNALTANWENNQATRLLYLQDEIKNLDLVNSVSREILEVQTALNLKHKQIVDDYNLKHISQIQELAAKEREINVDKQLAVEKWNAEHIEQLKELNKLQEENRKAIQGSNDELKKTNNELKKNGFKDFISGFKGALGKGLGGISRFASGAMKTIVTFITGRFLTRYAKQFAAFAGDYVENLNLIENSYGRNSEKVAQWAQEFSRSLGVSTNEVMKFAGSFQSLMETMVGTTEVGQQMSQVLTQLTYDIGSLRNMDFSEAYNKMQSTIFGGQLKTSRFLGVDISTNALDELLEDLGMVNVRARDLSEAEKVYLRFIKTVGSLEVSGAFGDLAETVSSVSNRIRILKGSWENLMTSIGNATNGIIGDLLASLIAIVRALNEVVLAFHKLPLSTSFNKLSESIDLVTESVEDLNESMGLLNIDKFNVLSQGETAGAGAGIQDELEGIAQEYVDRYKEISESFNNVDEKVERIKNNLLKWVFPNAIISDDALKIEIEDNTLHPLIQSIVDLVNTIASALKDIVGNEDFTAIINGVINILQSIIIFIKPLIKPILELLSVLIKGLLPILQFTVDILSPIVEMVGSLLSAISEVLDFSVQVLAPILKVLGIAIVFVFKIVSSLFNIVMSIFKWIFKILEAFFNLIGINNEYKYEGLDYATHSINSFSFGNFANSGIPDHGSLYWAGEGSRPEILYNAGGRTNVVDSEILGDQFYNAIVRANRTTGGSAGNGNMVAKLVINGKELADATFNDFDYYSRRTTGRGLISK